MHRGILPPPHQIQGGHPPTAVGAHYGVDMYFAGHTHSYVRSAPINGTALVVRTEHTLELISPEGVSPP